MGLWSGGVDDHLGRRCAERGQVSSAARSASRRL